MLLVFAFAVLALGRAELDIITSPAGPGNQYVRLQTGHQKDVKNLSVSQVQIKDEGLIGVQHKYPIKKAEIVQENKDVVGVKATVKDEGASGLLKKQSGSGVPPLKHLPYEVLSNNKEEDGGLDFDDDFHPLNTKKLVPAGTSQASRVNVKKGPNGQDYEYEYVYYYYDEDEEEPTTVKNKDTAVHESRTRQEVVEEEPKKRNEAARNRYTTIERGRATVTTTEQTNELVPRGGQRTRGRQFESQSIPQEEERLPANPRFPSRGRNGQTHTTQIPQTEIPTRSRTSNGNVRRPSLVDSSSFRTHSSDAAPDAAQEKYYTNHRNSAEIPQNTRESDLEEYVETVRPTTFSPPSTTTIRFHPLPPAPEEEDSMPDKAAHDLYAILQQTKEENYVSPGEVEEVTTEILTTPTTTTTSTTTTEATTTTTSTSTAAPARSRFRGVNGARARPRPSTFSTTQSSEPKEVTEEPKKSKFQPQRNRATSYRRSTTQAPLEESTTQKRSFGSSNRYRSRGKQQEEEKVELTTQAATSRPTRPRLNISGARPLRPGPKINLRRTSTQAPVSEEIATQEAPQEELIETSPATSPSPPPTPQDALSRLRNRPRLRVGARPHPAETSTTTTQPTEASTTPEETQNSTAEPAKPSPLLRRRPNIRRLTLPHSQPQQQQQQQR